MNIRLLTMILIILTAVQAAAFMPSGKGKAQPLTTALYSTGIEIVDIRTEAEWKQTGIVKGSHTITFYDEKGNYNAKKFLKELEKVVSKSEAFGLICRSGNRTTSVSDFLRKSGYKNVINLKGGVLQAHKNGVEFEKYRP